MQDIVILNTQSDYFDGGAWILFREDTSVQQKHWWLWSYRRDGYVDLDIRRRLQLVARWCGNVQYDNVQFIPAGRNLGTNLHLRVHAYPHEVSGTTKDKRSGRTKDLNGHEL